MPTKFKTSILIFGMIVMCLLACLATFLVLASSGVLLTEKTKLEITVQSATKIYDGTPLTADDYTIEGDLADGHKEVVVFTDSQTDVGEGESGAEVRILDEDGYDVTSMYAIKVNKGVLRVTRQPLSVAINDTEVVYSGNRIVFDDYLLQRGTLAQGHKIGAESAAGVIEPGRVDNATLNPAVYDAFGNDVTQNYDIAFAMGVVQVIPRPIVVRVRSASKVYDGKPLQAEGIEIVSGSLIAGHHISATAFQTISGDTAQIIEVGPLPVYVKTYSIYDAMGKNVSEYYKLSNDIGNPGIWEVTPRELTVVGKSKSWEYDGKPHSFTSTAGREDTETSAEMALGLAEGHTVKITYDKIDDNKITDVGSKPCLISSENVTVVEASGADKTRNYQITYVNGTLTVTPQNLRMTVKDYTVEYNGKAIPQEALKEQLVLFDAFTADDFELVMSGKEYKNAGEYSLSAKPYVNEHPQNEQEAQDEAERKNLFKNYKIDIVPGKVTILPKTITVTMKNKETSFNGKGIVASDISVADDISVPDTEKDVTFKVLGTTLEGVKNVGEYSYTAEVVALNGDGTVSSNYTVRSQAGMWKITPVKVKVKSNGTISKVYDGKPIEIAPSKLTLDFEGTDFQSGNYSVLSVDYDKTVRSACVGGEIDLSNVRIRDNTTGQECFNFVATGKVKVTVTKRALNISIGSITVKEGTSETEINNLVTMGGGYYNLIGLADGDNAVIVLVATRWNQDSPDLYIMVDEITIIDKFNVNINDMYDFSAIEEVMGSVFFI